VPLADTAVVVVALILVLLSGTFVVAVLNHTRRRRMLSARLQSGSRGADKARATLRSRARFMEDLELEVSRSDRTGRAACLLVLSFAEDPRSEDHGDAHAARLAHILDATLRKIDLRYRLGANEFAIILPETRAHGALVATGRVEQALRQADVSAIVGGVAEMGPGIPSNELFRHAYRAMLAARREQRTAVLAYSPELDPSATQPPETPNLSETSRA
jgi:diguanylate cyclase (GGDEF)-like protein